MSTRIQSVQASNTGQDANEITATLPAAPTPGNTLLAFCSTRVGGHWASSMEGWDRVFSYRDSVGVTNVCIGVYARAVEVDDPAGPYTFTHAAGSGGLERTLYLEERSGIDADLLLAADPEFLSRIADAYFTHPTNEAVIADYPNATVFGVWGFAGSSAIESVAAPFEQVASVSSANGSTTSRSQLAVAAVTTDDLGAVQASLVLATARRGVNAIFALKHAEDESNARPAKPTVVELVPTRNGLTLTGSEFSDPDDDEHISTRVWVYEHEGVVPILTATFGALEVVEIESGLPSDTPLELAFAYADSGGYGQASDRSQFTTLPPVQIAGPESVTIAGNYLTNENSDDEADILSAISAQDSAFIKGTGVFECLLGAMLSADGRSIRYQIGKESAAQEAGDQTAQIRSPDGMSVVAQWVHEDVGERPIDVEQDVSEIGFLTAQYRFRLISTAQE